MENAWASGQGAASRGSIMIDEASVRMAKAVLATAQRIEGKKAKADEG
jgi:hypothetical protein